MPSRSSGRNVGSTRKPFCFSSAARRLWKARSLIGSSVVQMHLTLNFLMRPLAWNSGVASSALARSQISCALARVICRSMPKTRRSSRWLHS